MNNIYKHKDITVQFIEEVSEDNFGWRCRLEQYLKDETKLLDDIDYFGSSDWLGDAIIFKDDYILISGNKGYIQFLPITPKLL